MIFLSHKLFIDVLGKFVWEHIDYIFSGRLYFIIPIECFLVFITAFLFSIVFNWGLKKTVYKRNT